MKGEMKKKKAFWKELKVLVFYLYICIQLQLHQCYATKCNRIIFDYLLSEENANSLSVVYIRTSLTNNGFPVFEDEKGAGSYFTAKNSRYWYFSKGSIDYRTGFTGLFSETYINMNELDREGSFGVFLRFCPEKQRNKYGFACKNGRRRGTSTIRCVSGMTDCGDKKIRYTNGIQQITFIKQKSTSGKDEYYDQNRDYNLYYRRYDDEWIIESAKSGALINYVFSKARKPEYIATIWRNHIGKGRLIECVGTSTRKCTSSSCKNSGICHTDRFGYSTWCTCKQRYYGNSCGFTEFTEQKQTTQLPTYSILKDREYQNKQSVYSIDGTDISTALKVFAILIPLILYCTHLCGSYIVQTKNVSCSRITSKHAYTGVLVWLMYIIIHERASLSQYGLNTFQFILITAIVFAVLGYIFNVIESLFFSREAGYFQSKMESRQGFQFLKNLLTTPPIITIHMECYHEEERTREVSYRDSHGNEKYRTEHYTVEVNTWSGQQRFNYLHWKDTSNRYLPQVTSNKPKMVNLQYQIIFADATTERAFDQQKQNFIEENKHRDTSYRTKTTKKIDGFLKHILIYDIEHGLPAWMKMRYYCLSIICLCSWPFRILLGSSSDKDDFEIRKTVSMDPFPPDGELPSNSSDRDIEVVLMHQPLTNPSIEDAPPSYYDAVNLLPSYTEVTSSEL